jgi:tagatose 1,6-diphosphate aldolase
MTYEMDGFENPRPHRMLALMPHLSVYRLRERGADGVKILLSWTPLDTAESNDQKRALIERIGAECAALDVPFFLEPLSYHPDGIDTASPEYASIKPRIVQETMQEFSQDRYGVDVLKVEFPVNAAYVEGTSVFTGIRIWTGEQALEVFRQTDAAAKRPYIYLSAGVSIGHFVESLRLAAAAGARFSGVLCGRATWQGGVNIFAREGVNAFERWLEDEGVKNISLINECLGAAVPWTERLAVA